MPQETSHFLTKKNKKILNKKNLNDSVRVELKKKNINRALSYNTFTSHTPHKDLGYEFVTNVYVHTNLHNSLWAKYFKKLIHVYRL